MNTVVDILGKQYRVVTKKLKGKYGTCKPLTCKITIDPDSAEEQQKDTLLHECIHALDSELGTEMKEVQVKLLATGLVHWMRANPEFVVWIMQTPPQKSA